MLEELTFSDHRMDGGWLAALSYWENLKTLRSVSCKRIDPSPGPDEYLGCCSVLERLHLQKCLLREKKSVRAMFRVCEAVMDVVFQDCWGLDNDLFSCKSVQTIESMEKMKKDRRVAASPKSDGGSGGNDVDDKEDFSFSNIKFNCFRNPSSKYDFVKVKVWLGDHADHYYVFSRFLLSRMLTVTKIPNHVALKITLELKKLLVDNSLLDVLWSAGVMGKSISIVTR